MGVPRIQFGASGVGANDQNSYGKIAGGPIAASVASAVEDPILKAANVQQQALQQAIPLFEPYQSAGLGGLRRAEQASTPQGLDHLITAIMNGHMFENIVDERQEVLTNQLAAGGLTRSGTAMEEAAAIPSDVALQIESLLTGRSAGIADMGLGATGDIADLTTQVGEAIASGILGVEQRRQMDRANRRTNRSNLMGSLIGGGASLIGANILASDPRLKENIEVIGKRGPLDIVKWKWRPETKGMIVEKMPTVGVLSPQVRKHYPHLVHEFGGYDMIDYQGLYRELWH